MSLEGSSDHKTSNKFTCVLLHSIGMQQKDVCCAVSCCEINGPAASILSQLKGRSIHTDRQAHLVVMPVCKCKRKF